jgi:ribosome maturation factor RimP
MSSHSSSQRPPPRPASRAVIDRPALDRVLEPVVRAHGAELVDVEFRPERGGWVLRVYVEKAGAADQGLSSRDAAVNLELCADVSRDLSPALDAVDLVPHAYQLEVSSPGIERPLRTERDFARFAGQKVRIKRRFEPKPRSTEPQGPGEEGDAGANERENDGGNRGTGSERVVVGQLAGIEEGRVRVVDGKRIHEIPFSSIEAARLVFEFGSSGKESQQRKH